MEGYGFFFFCHSLISACVLLRGLGRAEQASRALRAEDEEQQNYRGAEEVGEAQDVQLAMQTACDMDPESFVWFPQKCFAFLPPRKGK